jgi:hypothetical protein
MSSFSKILTGTVVGAGIITAFGYIKNLRKAQAALEIQPKASIHSIGWDGIIIRVDVLMKNPTKGSFSIKFPFVKIAYKNETIGSSQAIDKDIKIPAYGEALIDKILVQVPVSSVFSLVFTLIKSLYNKETVTLTVTTMTTINIGLAKIPFTKQTEVVVKK